MVCSLKDAIKRQLIFVTIPELIHIQWIRRIRRTDTFDVLSYFIFLSDNLVATSIIASEHQGE